MFARALIAFLVLPGSVGFALPVAWLWYTQHIRIIRPVGLVVFLLGMIGLIWCVRDFYVTGKGTLAPWAPPQKLVIVGLYRFSRNPMYLSVAVLLLGWSISFNSLGLFVYTMIVVMAFHLRVVYGEEPWLARNHGDVWQQYVKQVPRWLWRSRLKC
jgi:protein-S-isoprenylcysteine O-methyltransferase Ste14